MKVILYVVTDDKSEGTKFVKTLAKSTGVQVVVMGLLDKTNRAEKEEKLLWHRLFEIQTDFSNEGIITNVCFKNGKIDAIVGTIQTFDVLLCVVPKSKFCKLETEDFEELLKSVRCPFLLY